ncbi:MAG: molybdopterin-guanine dinucleotide biosynthesis protein B [Methyloligellaceae bacterium]
MTIPIFSIIGWKNSGKTTLMARLVEEFTARGLSVSAIKHAHHSFDIDHPERDTFKLREAGARQIAIASPRRWALMHELKDEPEPPLDEIISHFSGAEIVLVEGYKSSQIPKIEARSKRSLTQSPLAGEFPSVVAIASDKDQEDNALPHFQIDDIPGIANFILRYLKIETDP